MILAALRLAEAKMLAGKKLDPETIARVTDWGERAAILEFDGGVERSEAERRAAGDARRCL